MYILYHIYSIHFHTISLSISNCLYPNVRSQWTAGSWPRPWPRLPTWDNPGRAWGSARFFTQVAADSWDAYGLSYLVDLVWLQLAVCWLMLAIDFAHFYPKTLMTHHCSTSKVYFVGIPRKAKTLFHFLLPTGPTGCVYLQLKNAMSFTLPEQGKERFPTNDPLFFRASCDDFCCEKWHRRSCDKNNF